MSLQSPLKKSRRDEDCLCQYADWLHGLLFAPMAGVPCLKEKILFAILFNLLKNNIPPTDKAGADDALAMVRRNIVIRGYLSTYGFEAAKRKLLRRYPFIEESLIDYMFALGTADTRAIYPEVSAGTFKAILEIVPPGHLAEFVQALLNPSRLTPTSISRYRVSRGTFVLPKPGYDICASGRGGEEGAIRGVHITFRD